MIFFVVVSGNYKFKFLKSLTIEKKLYANVKHCNCKILQVILYHKIYNKKH